jgi:arabinose-5-phosphate isomerase
MEMTRKGLGMTTVVDGEGRLAGVFTDGDLRRFLDHGADLRGCGIGEVMTHPCVSVPAHLLAVEGLQVMEARKVNALPVVDRELRLVGALNMHDLLRAGVV